MLLRLLLALDDRRPHRARAVHHDVRAPRRLQRGDDQTETEPARAEVHVELVCGRARDAGDGGREHVLRPASFFEASAGARKDRDADAPLGDLNTLASGFISEMKFIIALSGSDISERPSSSTDLLGFFDVSAKALTRSAFRALPRATRARALFKARAPGRNAPGWDIVTAEFIVFKTDRARFACQSRLWSLLRRSCARARQCARRPPRERALLKCSSRFPNVLFFACANRLSTSRGVLRQVDVIRRRNGNILG